MAEASPALVEHAPEWTGVRGFPAGLEHDFRADYFRRSLWPMRVGLLLAAALFGLFGALDVWMVPEAWRSIWLIRYAVVVPLLVATYGCTFSRRFPPLMQPALAGAALVGGGGLVAMVALASPATGLLYYAGLLLAFAWMHGLVRLSFRNASLVSWTLTLAYEATAIWWLRLPGALLANNTFFLVAANIIGMFVSYHFEASFRRDFLQRRLLEARTREAETSMQRLREAQDRLAHAERRSAQALENLPVWAEGVAADIRRAIDAGEVRVWELSGRELNPLTPGATTAPDLEALRAPGEAVRTEHGRALVPITGVTGELYGAVVVSRVASWDEDRRRLVASFARHLGGVLEIRRMRRDLAEAEARREAVRQRMQARGERPLLLCPGCGRCYDDQHTACPADGSTLTQRLLPHRLEGRYRMIRLLGRGGMGDVYEALDEALGRPVAIKVLRADRGLDPDQRAQLYREARAAARISHPGVVEIYDVGDLDDGSAYLVMELVAGRSLAELLEQGVGSPAQVAALLRAVASAVGAAHRTGVVHRDLKPENVFLSPAEDGFVAKVLDFGISRTVDVDATASGRGMIMGTPAYMSPEQVRGAPVDARSDVYSLAVLAFEALTGRRVAARASIAETLLAVLGDPVPPPSTLVPGLPASVDAAFAAALDKDPAGRPVDVEAWVDSFADALAATPSARPGWAINSLQGPPR